MKLYLARRCSRHGGIFGSSSWHELMGSANNTRNIRLRLRVLIGIVANHDGATYNPVRLVLHRPSFCRVKVVVVALIVSK